MIAQSTPWSGSAPDPANHTAGHASAADFLRRLPALPAASSRILALMAQPDVDIKQLSSIIVSDAVLSMEILRMSNSAALGVRCEVRSILHAIAILGTERVKGLATTVALQNYLGNVLQVPALKRCWRHNTATAIVANELAGWARADAGEAYTLGILHDIGRLGLIAMDPAQYIQVLDTAVQTGQPLCEVEAATYGMDHTECGVFLAKLWRLPKSIQDVACSHHSSGDCKDPMAALIYYACSIADYFGFSCVPQEWQGDSPVAVYIATLPELLQKRLFIEPGEMQLLIASQINALEA